MSLCRTGLSLSAPHFLSLCLSLSITFPFPSLYVLSSFFYPIFQCSSLCPPPLLPQPSDVSIDVKLISACGILPREGGSTLCISLPHWQTQIIALFIFHPLHYFCPWIFLPQFPLPIFLCLCPWMVQVGQTDAHKGSGAVRWFTQ